MKTSTFKLMLTENKSCLTGKELTIYVGVGDWPETFDNLDSFNARILELEKSGYTFEFEHSLTIVRATYVSENKAPTHQEICNDVKMFGTSA